MSIEPEPTNFSSTTPAITGQMAHIVFALRALSQDIKVPPLGQLKPGQLHKRVDNYLRAHGFDNLERPSRSTFDRFRRQFGPAFGIR
jgi:hypothetical protein